MAKVISRYVNGGLVEGTAPPDQKNRQYENQKVEQELRRADPAVNPPPPPASAPPDYSGVRGGPSSDIVKKLEAEAARKRANPNPPAEMLKNRGR